MKRGLGLALWLAACGTSAPAQDTSQPRPRGVFPSETANQPGTTTTPAEATPQNPAEATPAPQQAAIKPKAAPEAVEDKPAERDLNAELLAALGSPVDCLKPRVGEGAPTSLRVQLDATVVEAGLVTRAYAHSSQLEADELQCMTKRVSALRLRGPIPEAPRSLSATLELTAKTAENPTN